MIAGLGAPTAFAGEAQHKRFGVSAEAGLNGGYGLLGIEASVHPSERYDIHAGAGIGGSVMLGVGARLFSDREDCFLFKNCDERYFLSTTLSRSAGGEIVEKRDGVDREFDLKPVNFLSIAAGNREVFFQRLALDLTLGYRLALNKAEAEQTNGPVSEDAKKDIEEPLKSGPQVTVALGFLF